MEITAQPSRQREEPRSLPVIRLKGISLKLKNRFLQLLVRVRLFGISGALDEYEQRKLGIFNQLNFFQLLTGILIPLLLLVNHKHIPLTVWSVAFLPALVSAVVLYLNYTFRKEAALICYFLFYPFVTCIVYMSGLDPGTDLFFILYGILAVFFLQDLGYIIFALCYSLVSYFLLSVVLDHYRYELKDLNHGLYLFNHALALGFIFYGLFLIKKENSGYQYNILGHNRKLIAKKEQIETQANKLKETSALLEKQAIEMAELNTMKNKLFSVISHDLKAPMYALRNLFEDIHHKKVSADILKNAVPDILKDLNYTVGLMENLLQWAKSQMQTSMMRPQEIEITQTVNEVLQILQLQAKAKQINIINESKPGITGYADKDMLNLVLRNLISNAIKFTPRKGDIHISLHEHDTFVEVYVQDSGCGITPEALEKINKSGFYSTRGTDSETGTGLGLMLCREFLAKNGGHLHVESEVGKGSVFSFTILKLTAGKA